MDYAILSKPEVIQFINNWNGKSATDLLLKKQLFPGITNKQILQQIEGLTIANQKFQSSFIESGIAFPPKQNLEQCSSWATALFKAGLVSGNTIVDLTGGFGIDSLAFSAHFKTVIHNEPEEKLSEIVQFNFKQMNIQNIQYQNLNAEKYPFSSDVEWYYLDPSRRKNGNKFFLLKDSTPNLGVVLKQINLKKSGILLKLSPMLDLTSIEAALQLKAEYFVVSVKGECKEILVKVRGILKENLYHAVDLSNDGVNYKIQVCEVELKSKSNSYGSIQPYVYIPDANFMKLGAFGYLSKHFSISKLHPNSHIFSGNETISNFPGKCFKVFEVLSTNLLEQKLKENGLKQNSFHVISRNFPLSAEEISKKYKLVPAGTEYLIATTNSNNEKVIIYCELV